MLKFESNIVVRPLCRRLLIAALLMGMSLPMTALAQNSCQETEVVTAGETLTGVAQRCNITLDALQQANPTVAGRALQAGDQLTIPTVIGAEATSTAGTTVEAPVNGSYTVQQGDSLIVIARRFNISYRDLLAANPFIYNPNLIRPGWTLAIPGAGPVQPSALPGEASQADATQATLEDAPQDDSVQALALQADAPPESAAPASVEQSANTSETAGLGVQVQARGFSPNAPVEVALERTDGDYLITTTIQADGQGAVQHTMPLPAVAAPGQPWLLVLREQGAPTESLIDAFTVPGEEATQGGTPVDLYLVALGAGGELGSLTGCDGAITPIAQTIRPTVSPMTGALQALLQMKERRNGEAGLYNPLSQSTLTLDRITIANERADVNLTGDLQTNDACEQARIQAQLAATALQFPAVNEVQILINGQPLAGITRK